MAKKVFTRETIAVDVEKFKANEFSKVNMTLDWMDNYVAMYSPETMEEYISKCLSFPAITRKIGGENRTMRDVKAVRDYFIATYFPDFTEEALKAKKEQAKAEREAKRAEKEAEKKMTAEEKFRKKMEELAKK